MRPASSVRIDPVQVGPDARASHNLPTELTSLVGREQEIGDARHLLATTRLLTLTGAGGVGKTRLALQVARDFVNAVADGVWLTELAPVVEPTGVPQALASAGA